jgi:hypothetical protein
MKYKESMSDNLQYNINIESDTLYERHQSKMVRHKV